ncbi:MAG: DUF1801 domain-containing protein [Cumulibacter sp.]
MPAPQRSGVQDFFDRLEPQQREHLERLREISLSYVPRVSEELRWNQPAYIADGMQWMLQAFGKHCSLRFTPEFFADHRGAVAAAGYGYGAAFLKILYAEEVPEALCRQLIDARLARS